MTVFVIVIWSVVAAAFLAKQRRVRELVNWFCAQSVFAKVAVSGALVCAIVYGSTKPDNATMSANAPPVETLHATSPTNSVSTHHGNSGAVNPVLVQTLHATSLPEWFVATGLDATDSDGDGIPDVWEEFTYTEIFVDDSALDYDNDGLTNLEEFRHETNPWNPDSDFDGFGDAYEIAHGMNPAVPEDFDIDEPDANNNGMADYFENVAGVAVFNDSNNDGFDDHYLSTWAPRESDYTYEVAVDVFTMRSAVLSVSGQNAKIALPASDNFQRVKLRLNYNDTLVALSPEPPSGDIIPGSWKAAMFVSFLPSAGQVAEGDFMTIAEDSVVKRTAIREETLTYFSDDETGSQSPRYTVLMSTGSAGDDSENPQTLLTQHTFGIWPEHAVWHSWKDEIDFAVYAADTNELAIINSVSWTKSTPKGGIYKNGKYEAELVTQGVPYDTTITVTANVNFTGAVNRAYSAEVEFCRHPYIYTSEPGEPAQTNSPLHMRWQDAQCTKNFSPHLGGSATFTVENLPTQSCEHSDGWGDYTFQMEVMRAYRSYDGSTKWQHVSWIDLDPSTEALEKELPLPIGATFSVNWDGIATEGASSAQAPDDDVFFETGMKSAMPRSLPGAAAGEPVPPPFYTVFARILDRTSTRHDKNTVQEISRLVYVPQVVKITWTDEAVVAFRRHLPYGYGNNITNLYNGYTGTTAWLKSEVVSRTQAKFPADVNIIFVSGDTDVLGEYKHMYIIDVMTNTATIVKDAYAYAQHVPQNCFADGTGELSIGRYIDYMNEAWKYYLRDNNRPIYKTPIPHTSFLDAVTRVLAHETGHLTGLVDNWYMDGNATHHNPIQKTTEIMSETISIVDLLDANLNDDWRPINKAYLQFVLPKPK